MASEVSSCQLETIDGRPLPSWCLRKSLNPAADASFGIIPARL